MGHVSLTHTSVADLYLVGPIIYLWVFSSVTNPLKNGRLACIRPSDEIQNQPNGGLSLVRMFCIP